MEGLQTLIETAIRHLTELWIQDEIEEKLHTELIHDLWTMLEIIKINRNNESKRSS